MPLLFFIAFILIYKQKREIKKFSEKLCISIIMFYFYSKKQNQEKSVTKEYYVFLFEKEFFQRFA